MDSLTCIVTLGGHVFQAGRTRDKEEGIALRVVVFAPERMQRRQLMAFVRGILEREKIPWLSNQGGRWIVDADAMKVAFPALVGHVWFAGLVAVEPEQETFERELFKKRQFEESAVAYITRESMGEIMMPVPIGVPTEISESIVRFKADHPDPAKTAFVIMRFGSTQAHAEIVTAIRDTLKALGITALRADDKQYHDDVWANILTYIHGSALGVAVFERLETDDVNPNVSLEVGYMMGMRKPVCLLKDSTVKTLQSDLVGKLYRKFDPQKPASGIASELEAWVRDKALV